MANDICNRGGLDTISGGSVIAFAMELYENGIIPWKIPAAIDLKWGNHQAIIALTDKVIKREGLGDILADGVKKAAEKNRQGRREICRPCRRTGTRHARPSPAAR